MKLSTKSVTVLLLVLLLTLSLSGWLHVQRERRVLTELMEKHGKSLSHSIAASCIEILLSEDYPILDSYLETMGKERNDILFIEVKHHGKVVSKYPTTHEGISDSVTFYSDVLFPIKGNKPLKKIGEVRLGLSDRENKMIIAARLRELLIFFASVFVFLALIEILLINKIVIKPIRKLADGICRVARGELANPVNIESRDEIGNLAASFNKMADDLQKTTVSRDYVDSIIGSMIDTLIVVKPDSRIKMANEATYELLGYKEEELIDKPFETILVDEIASEKVKLEELMKVGYSNHFELEYKAKDGRKIPMFLSGTVMKDKNGEITNIVFTGKDITEQKRMDEDLKRTTRQLSLMLESLPIIPYMCKAEGNFGITYIGTEVEKITGFKPEDFTSNDTFWVDRIHPDDATRIFADIPTLFEKGHYEHEYRWQVADDSYKWFYDVLRLVKLPDKTTNQIVGIWLDITERKQEEDKLREAEYRYRTLFEQSPNAVVIIDPETMLPIEYNDTTLKLLGYTSDEFRKLPISEYEANESPEETRSRIEIAKRKGKDIFETRMRTKQGNIKDVIVNIRVINISGKLVFHNIFYDITERKKAKEILEEQKKVLEQKNIALSEVLGQIEIEKKQIKDNVIANAENLILPIIQKLRLTGESRKYVQLLRKNLQELTSSFGTRLTEKGTKLTSREIEICDMIKNGLTSKEIASLLNISLLTIEKHRSNIRRKLGVINKDINLTSFLKRL